MRSRHRGRETRRRAPSSAGPDEHARIRRQDRSTAPHRRHHEGLPHRRLPRRLRRDRTRHPKIRHLDPRRAPVPAREQDPETGHAPLRVRGSARPLTTRLLRPQDRTREAPQPSTHCPRPMPIRRAVRDAPRRNPLPAAHHRTRPRRLTEDIGAPPKALPPQPVRCASTSECVQHGGIWPLRVVRRRTRPQPRSAHPRP